MAWGDPGVNTPIYVNDQEVNVSNWGAGVVKPATTRIQSAGFIRGLLLRMPKTVFAGPVLTGSETVALQPSAQLGSLRTFSEIRVSTQVVNDLLHIRGEDAYFLDYVNSGRRRADADNYQKMLSLQANNNAPNGGNASANYLTAESINAVSTSTALAADLTYMIYLPISQNIVMHNTINVPDGTGKGSVPVRFDRETEIGFINVQNDRFAMQPRFTLNPMWSAGVDSWLVETNGYAATPANFSFYLDVDMYPVPDSAGDMPPAELLSFVYQRRNTFTDIQVQNGSYTYRPDPAGLLTRFILLHYDTNDNLVDVSVNPLGTIDLQWGTSVHRVVESVQRNLARCASRYGTLPPQGALIYDFLADDNGGLAHSLPPELSNTKCVVSGLPASVTTTRVIEERLIPVTAG